MFFQLNVPLVTLPVTYMQTFWRHREKGKGIASNLTTSFLPLCFIWLVKYMYLELLWTQWLRLQYLDQDSSTGDLGLDLDLGFSDSQGETAISPRSNSNGGATHNTLCHHLSVPLCVSPGLSFSVSLSACVCLVLYVMCNIYVGRIRDLHGQVIVICLYFCCLEKNRMC